MLAISSEGGGIEGTADKEMFGDTVVLSGQPPSTAEQGSFPAACPEMVGWDTVKAEAFSPAVLAFRGTNWSSTIPLLALTHWEVNQI